MTIKSIGDAHTSADAVQLEDCSRSSRQRRRRRRHGRSNSVVRRWQGRSNSVVLLVVRAALAVVLIDASQGMLVHMPTCSKSMRSGVSATKHALKVSPLASWERRRLSRNCASDSIEDNSELGSTGAGGAAACEEAGAVHTLLIDNYDSYTYNLFQLLAVVNGRSPFVVYNDDDGGDLW